MDKGWISLPRWHPAYIPGVKDFVKYACGINPNSNEIMCPCKKCRNVKLVKKEVRGEHLMIDGFLPSYTCWIFHGEFVASPVARTEDKGQSDSYEGDEMHELLYDAFGIPPFAPPTDDTTGSSSNYGPDEKTKKFFSLLKEAERELYPGCSKFSTLSFIVRLLHIKTLSGWTDKSFTMLLELLKEAFPEGDTLPKSFYATRVLLKDLGLDYHKVDACPKDCSLYWKDTADRENCIVCHHPRYKQFEKEQTHIFQAQMQEQFQLYRVQFETQMKEMMETQMAAMRTQMDATIQAQAATIQTQQTRMEYLESQLVTRGGLAAREAAWGHHPMSRSQQNSHEFTSSSSHQKVAQSKTKNKSKSKRRPHI